MKLTTKMLSTLIATATLGLSSLFTTGCVITTSGGGTIYYGGWYDVYGSYCGTTLRPGCNFYSDGSKIIDIEDPYYSAGNTIYYGLWTYNDSFGYPQAYTGWGWQSSNGIIYDQYGYALNEEGASETRELTAEVAQKEEDTAKAAGKLFSEKYALSEDVGVHIAKTLSDWATLSRRANRARTEADIADFSKRLYGVSLEQTTVALETAKKGDASALVSLNSDVAQFWGTDAQTSAKILKNWYRAELNELNVQ